MNTLSVHELEHIHATILNELRSFTANNGFKKVLVGCSGGLDSALTIVLAAQALGPENVTAITMPSQYSSQDSVTDSQTLCKALGVELLGCPIGFPVDTVRNTMADNLLQQVTGVGLENLQARMRGLILMTYSNMNGHLLLGTSNKSEILVGYCTLYGDTCGGLNLLGNLYKTEVFALARFINDSSGRELVPEAILSKAPSADLTPGQKDTDSLPPYDILDPLLQSLQQGHPNAAHNLAWLREKLGPQALKKLHERIATMVRRNAFKQQQLPPSVCLSRTTNPIQE